ncbi:MAG: ABC transporter ATP-binding protein [Ferruginibacter sp.]
MSSIIKINDLSKSFIISHEKRENYTALRDVISSKAKKLFSFPKWMSTEDKTTKEVFWALKNINFEIQPGDRVGIIGRNGAGKSTLLKILSRITEPTSGAVKIKGRVASLLEVGTGFHPELTGKENIFLNGAILGMKKSEIKRHFDAIVDFAEIEKFLDTPVKRYSSGMYVRLAFAVAAHLEPEILIVDEVLAVGDAQFQKKCLGKMEDVSRNEGRTVLFVSHNLGIISQLCNRGLLLNAGELVMDASSSDVIKKYFSDPSAAAVSFNNQNKKNKDIHFDAVSLMDSNGKPCTQFAFDDDVLVNIRFSVKKQVPALNLGIAMINHEKRRVFTVNKYVEELQLQDNGQYGKEINFEIKGSLFTPAQYSFQLALNNKIGSITHDYIDDVCPFTIYDNGTDMAFASGSNYGAVIIKGNWK